MTTTTPPTRPSTAYSTKETDIPTVSQRRARAKAVARPGRAANAGAAQSRIDSYVPKDVVVRDHVLLIRDVVRATGPVNAEDAAELLGAVAGLAAWLWGCGHEVNAETLTSPHLAQRWVLVGCDDLTAGTAANYRSRLSRVAAAVTGVGDARRVPLHASGPVAPYTWAQEQAWAAMTCPTTRMTLDLRVAMLLGFGAGLPAAALASVRGGDVNEDADGGVHVRVAGTRERTVPVRTMYAPQLLVMARAAGDAPLFKADRDGGPGKNALSNLVASARRTGGDPDLPALTAQRMRATWIVRHLDAGVRADLVARYAGLDDLGSLDRYVQFLRPVADADAFRTFYGAGA